LANLKFLRNEELGFPFGVAENRKVSLEQGKAVQIQTLASPESGLRVYLKEFGWVKVFCQDFKNEARYYIEGAVSELYDVVSIPAVQRPMAIGVRSDEIRRVISMGEA
jgi:hypothetical protein